ncbi:CaiB/BaiF CoA transferase family protein [Vannielia litorea]|uniref:CaiB/BaiF CoA transferase family protein n=1 Tax=Vannielia litorea TaxID=1217970 RepID=UPI001BCE6D69|nr:CoA transferase [Vannielia litorea]MBS8224684.1 CoA transferase [Vannielia litorea]
MNRPLEGIRVIELGAVITGPYASSLLAELGAEVVKVERPDGGDPFRSFLGGTYSPHFQAYNKNKRSVVLDLSVEEEKDKLRSLVQTADVLIDNFRPGVLSRLGLDDDTLENLNPGLIRCSITGFGQDGPYAARPAYDAVAQSLAGIAGMFVDPENPRMTGPTISDNVTGMYAALGVLAALLGRERKAGGRRVDVNMLEASMAFIPDPFAFDDSGMTVTPTTRVAASQSYAVRCRDGRCLALHLSSLPKFWDALCAAIEREDLRTAPMFETRPKRFENYALLAERLNEVFAARDRDAWIERLSSFDIPFAPINTIPEAVEDPQVRHLGTFYGSRASDGTEVRSLHCPIWFDGERIEPQGPPPLLGEHTDDYITTSD